MTADEGAFRDLLDTFARAIYNKNAAGAIALLTDDAVGFDLAPPLRMDSEAMHDPEGLEDWFGTWAGPIALKSHDVKIAVDGGLGHAYGLQHLTGTKIDGEDVDLWFRSTVCFRREGGRWRIAHIHNSVPFAMDGSGKALLDLKP